jgi:chromosome segregation protein
MHLREVQMENFKSFGRRISVPFEPGYTAITGPNGAGKSNIGDAILFVLGPNSPRALRAGRLSDLIFNGGGQGRAADHCTVALVFDNTDRSMPVDADTVTLTRKVKLTPKDDNPDGYTSYFYVNGRASQKKEFIDLLNHVRISADGYNITLQGDVQHICTMTPMERRRILDDIAGVTAFDRDIQQADARKADVLANLERIGIVLSEIERSLEQLDKDRAAAAKYRELQEAAKRLKGLMAWRRAEGLKGELAEIQRGIEKWTQEREKLAQQHADVKARHDEASARFAELEQKIQAEGGEEAAQLGERMKAARDQMVRLEEKINFARLEMQGAQEAVAPLADELRRADKELEKTRKLQEAMAAEHAEATKALASRTKELDGLRDMISKSDSGAMQLNKELVQLKAEHEAKQLELHESRLESDRTGERRKAVERGIAEAASQLAAVQTDLKETRWQLKELEKTTGGADRKRKEAQAKLLELKKALAEWTQQAEELENRIRRLGRERTELQAQEEAAARAQGGYGRAVQDVLEARDKRQIKGIVGTVAELAKVDDKLQAAMQVAAAGRLTAIVVEDDAVAQQCIELVKRKGSGRATFLPLNKMVPGRPSGQALMKVKEPGCLGFAIDLIQFNARYQNAFWHVFQDTLLVDTMATGRRMMGGVRLVTLEGELFEKSGAMSGGSNRNRKGEDAVQFTNADRGRIDELLAEIAKAESAQQDAIARVTATRSELDDLQARLAADGAATTTHEDRFKDLERKAEQLAGRETALEGELARLRKEAKELEAAGERLDKQVAALADRLEEMEKIRVEKQQLLLKGTRKDLKERVEALEAQVRSLHETALKAENRRDVAATQLKLVEAARAEKAAVLESRGGDEKRHADDIQKLTKAHAKAQAEVEALMKMERKATGALKGLQTEKEKRYRDIVDLRSRLENLATKMESHFSIIAAAKGKMPAVEEALGEALMELKENPVEVAAADQVPPMEDLKRELRNAEASLDRMGAVNMTALEQYDAQANRAKELKEEVAHLNAQKDDLTGLVAEIQTRKKAALMEVFTAINENFRAVYAQISVGGTAYMELENEADPFQGGLILKAQPPGKKVLRLDALSGGEKSLTSMAFIFALQRYDPSPFYYFDEVDQNLDAVNSELLSRMIKENAKFAQFIVVSLRKITLKEASHIYGVTQQAPGLSEIIAHFDIDTLRDEEKGEGADGHDGEDGPASQPPAAPAMRTATKKAKPKAEGAKKETTLADVIPGMMAVEVKK